MNRRNFLRRAGALGIPFVAGMPGLPAAGNHVLARLLNQQTDRVLVLVQLVGGNDGLHTLIGLDQYANLRSVRPNIVLSRANTIAIKPDLALHGQMGGMAQLFAEQKLTIVQSVGYPNQNRSHFRSTDIWTSASDSATIETTGWIGRHLEVDHPDFPVGYPNNSHPDPLAVTLGNVANETCQGTVTNLSLTVGNPDRVTDLPGGTGGPLPNDNYGSELGFLRTTMEQTNRYGARVQAAAGAGSSTAAYPGGRFGRDLSNVVRLITGGLGTRIYVVTLGGFDTHAQQGGDSGKHSELMTELSAGLTAFQRDLETQGVADRVLGMTFSEFGRRIRSNSSNGTDHGTAAPLFLFGNCATGTVLGNNPTIDTGVDQQAGVPMQYDFRDIYGSVLVDWFGVDDSTVRSVLYPSYTYLPVANGCSAVLPVELLNLVATGADRHVDIVWQTATESGNRGFAVERSTDGRDFDFVGWVPAAGNGDSTEVSDYAFRDADVQRGPLYYYRLKQVDTDGGFEYSHVVTARLRGTSLADWRVGHPFPNPAAGQTTLQLFAPQDDRVTYRLYSSAGQLVLSDSATVYGNRDNQLEVRLGRLPAGNYSLRVEANGLSEVRGLVVR